MADKKKRNRSPNYPVVSLETAVGYLRSLSDFANGTHPVPVVAAIETAWKMKKGSGYGLQVAAALKAFGLVKDKGTGKTRQISITEQGAKLLGGHSDQQVLLKDAALSPVIHKDIWSHYKGDLPPDVTIRQYLLFDRDGNKFNEAVVDEFIKEFRDTIKFAKLVQCDTISDDKDVDIDHDEQPNGSVDSLGTANNRGKPHLSEESNQDVFTLGHGQMVVRWPKTLTRDDFEDLKGWLEILQRQIGRWVEKQEQQEQEEE